MGAESEHTCLARVGAGAGADGAPQESSRSRTGYTNIIEVGGKFQARWQLTGDGRGGKRKRKQCPLPGIFDTALEAATYLALVKKLGVARVDKAAV